MSEQYLKYSKVHNSIDAQVPILYIYIYIIYIIVKKCHVRHHYDVQDNRNDTIQ